MRYNPDDLREVRVYDDQDRFLCTAQQTEALGYFADKDELAEKIRENRKYMKTAQEWRDLNVKKSMSELDLLIWQAERNLEEDSHKLDPKIIRIQSADEVTESQMQRAVGDGYEQIDYTAAVERIRKAREE